MLTGLFVLATILTLIAILQNNQSGGLIPKTLPTIPLSFNYSRQYNELNNVNNVLKRPLVSTNKYINNITPLFSSLSTDSQKAELLEPIVKYMDFSDIVTVPTSENLKSIVESKQPYFMGNAKVTDFYEGKYYWDWRFPKQNISVEFAKDPIKFCQEHPKEYPSYVITSRLPVPLGNEPDKVLGPYKSWEPQLKI